MKLYVLWINRPAGNSEGSSESPKTVTVSLDAIEPSDSISTVKRQIAEAEHMAVDPLCFKLVFAGKKLDDDSATVESCRLTDGSTVHLVVTAPAGKITITVSPVNSGSESAPALLLDVLPSDPVHTVKKRIQERMGVATDKQQLVFAGHVMQDNDSPLSDFEISDGSTLILVVRQPPRMPNMTEVNFKLITGKDFSFLLEESETIAQIKDRISEKEGYPTDRIRLIRKSIGGSPKPLDDDSATVATSQILANDIIYVLYRMRGS